MTIEFFVPVIIIIIILNSFLHFDDAILYIVLFTTTTTTTRRPRKKPFIMTIQTQTHIHPLQNRHRQQEIININNNLVIRKEKKI